MNKLIVFCGPPLSGKTHIASRHSKNMGICHLEMDEIVGKIIENSRHIKKERDIGYRAMHLIVFHLLSDGISVIVDATYGRKIHRAALKSLVDKTGVTPEIIECQVSETMALERFQLRKNHPATDMSEERVKFLIRTYPYSLKKSPFLMDENWSSEGT